MWTSKAYAHSSDESAGDACEDGDKRTLLAKSGRQSGSAKRRSLKRWLVDHTPFEIRLRPIAYVIWNGNLNYILEKMRVQLPRNEDA